MKTTSKTGKNQKFSRKVQGHLNHKFFSEHFISDSLNVFSKPMGAINFWIV